MFIENFIRGPEPDAGRVDGSVDGWEVIPVFGQSNFSFCHTAFLDN
jgi:hypothetical protein